MKNRPGTMINHENHKNQPETTKTGPGIMKNQKKQPGIKRNRPTTMKP